MTSRYLKLSLVTGGVVAGGYLLMKAIIPSEEQYRKRLTPEQRRQADYVSDKLQDANEEMLRKLKNNELSTRSVDPTLNELQARIREQSERLSTAASDIEGHFERAASETSETFRNATSKVYEGTDKLAHKVKEGVREGEESLRKASEEVVVTGKSYWTSIYEWFFPPEKIVEPPTGSHDSTENKPYPIKSK